MASTTFSQKQLAALAAIPPTTVCGIVEHFITAQMLSGVVASISSQGLQNLHHLRDTCPALTSLQLGSISPQTVHEVREQTLLTASLPHNLPTMSFIQQADALCQIILHTVKQATGRMINDIHAPLMQSGLDSLAGIELINALCQLLGIDIAVTVLFQFPTVHQMAVHLLSLLVPVRGQLVTGVTVSTDSIVPSTSNSRLVAIFSTACRLPGSANASKQLWQNLMRKDDAIVGIPLSRWNSDSIPYDTLTAKDIACMQQGGFIDGITLFDADFFNVAILEATYMDPQQRWLLTLTSDALQEASLLQRCPTQTYASVYVGISTVDFAAILRKSSSRSVYLGAGVAPSIASGRLAFQFKLSGPCISIDTACSSSLVALHLGKRNVQSTECPWSLAAGVHMMLDPRTTEAIAVAGMLSPDCRCKTFDASANGYVRGEGCVTVVIGEVNEDSEKRKKVSLGAR